MAEGENMKANIHPEVKDATVTCACGATFQTKSTNNQGSIQNIKTSYLKPLSQYQ